jgi:hypothetical protein
MKENAENIINNKTFLCWYVNIKPMLIQARDEEEAKAQAMKWIRTGYPFKIEKCVEVEIK